MDMVLLKTWICTRITDILGGRSSLDRVITMDEVGVIFRLKKYLLNIWEAMKGDAYMHSSETQLISLFNKLE